MSRTYRFALAILAVVMAVTNTPFPPSLAKSSPPYAFSSTLADQTGISITIYNVNLGLVKDRRTVSLAKGRQELRFMDVASQIIPASVHIRSLTEPDSFFVLEQNYEYDLLNPQKLLDKYVGKEVKLYQKNPYTEREDLVTATLLANNNGPIFRIGDEVTFGHPGRVIFPGVPEDLISKPTLVWLMDNSLDKPQIIETSYLTEGISWRADYVVILNETDDHAGISSWVTIDNRSGATYREATLKLVAGDVNRTRDEIRRRNMSVPTVAAATAAPQFREEAFFEYHIYSLERPSTIKDNQIKQINLVTTEAVPLKKEFLFRGENYYYYNPYGDMAGKQKIGVFLEIENKKVHNLGIPLPKGTVRVYKRDSAGSLQFIGEDAIDHTPQDEKLRIKLGEAFDLVGSRKQTDWKKLAADTYEAAFEISLRNHKRENVAVKILEPIPGDWQIINSSHEYTKTESSVAEFIVPVPKDSETKLSYRVKMRY